MDDVNGSRGEEDQSTGTRSVEDTGSPSSEEQKADAQRVEARNTDDGHLATDDAIVDEWGEESFPGSDPPANY